MPRHDPARHHCPRCGTTGDPRVCICMKVIRRRLDELRFHLRRNENFKAGGHLTEAERLMDLLALDAQHQARDNRPDQREAA